MDRHQAGLALLKPFDGRFGPIGSVHEELKLEDRIRGLGVRKTALVDELLELVDVGRLGERTELLDPTVDGAVGGSKEGTGCCG